MRQISHALCIAVLGLAACSQRVSPSPGAPPAGPPLLVRTITFGSMEGIPASEILKYFRERGVALSVERRYRPKDVEEAKVVLGEFLAQRGYPDAQIETEVVAMPPRAVEVRFTISR